MNPIKVYIAGKYSADNVIEVLQNIGYAEEVAAILFENGFAPFCPHHNKDFCIRLYGTSFTKQQFYDYSLAWLEVSDVMFVISGTHTSVGVKAEIKFAHENNIPIFYHISDLRDYRYNLIQKEKEQLNA
ncbi:MAG TPA: hypothetical protein VJ878_01155 [Candidatus Izemoplasmatales bacterium]|nr:hypothetical protein [Candidatus Izemoplasmatales bacterium]